MQLVWAQLVLVQQDVVVHRPAGALDGGVRVQIEVILRGVHNSLVHHRPCSTHTISSGNLRLPFQSATVCPALI